MGRKKSISILLLIFIIINYFSIFNKYEKYLNDPFLNISNYNNDFLIINRFGHLGFHNISIIDFDFMIELIKINEYNDLIFSNIERSKIKNILFLVAIFPYLNDKSIIICNIKTKHIYNLFKSIFTNGIITSKHIIFTKYDLKYLLLNYNKLIYNKWETIPDDKFLKVIRYVINKYYNESFLNLFELALNLNFKYFFQSQNNNFTFNEIDKLMSKLNYLCD